MGALGAPATSAVLMRGAAGRLFSLVHPDAGTLRQSPPAGSGRHRFFSVRGGDGGHAVLPAVLRLPCWRSRGPRGGSIGGSSVGLWRRDNDDATEQVHSGDRAEVYWLVERARGGDRAALGQLYDRYSERIFRFAVSRTRDVSDAEDLVSEVFIAASASLATYRWTGAPFASWLFGIAQNKLHKTLEAAASGDLELVMDAGSDDDALGAFERRHDMLRQLRRLKPYHQQILMLRFYGSMTAEEVAETVGSNANAVRQAQFEAIRQLRRMMSQERAA